MKTFEIHYTKLYELMPMFDKRQISWALIVHGSSFDKRITGGLHLIHQNRLLSEIEDIERILEEELPPGWAKFRENVCQLCQRKTRMFVDVGDIYDYA